MLILDNFTIFADGLPDSGCHDLKYSAYDYNQSFYEVSIRERCSFVVRLFVSRSPATRATY